jgi:hypothetical protein
MLGIRDTGKADPSAGAPNGKHRITNPEQPAFVIAHRLNIPTIRGSEVMLLLLFTS